EGVDAIDGENLTLFESQNPSCSSTIHDFLHKILICTIGFFTRAKLNEGIDCVLATFSFFNGTLCETSPH
ncbi:hypothetical protein PENTCL1PPCAC_8040, partial [Pristionchus entomophagus]